MSAWLRPGAMLLLGVLCAGAFAPFSVYPLSIFALAVLTDGWRGVSARRAAALGFAFGLGLYLAGVSWVYVSMNQFGGMPGPLAAVATLLFCAYLACFPAAAGWLCARLAPAEGWTHVLVAAAAWALTEWARGALFTGFPWLALGYAQAPPSPLAGYAPVLGVFGLSFLSVLAAGCLALAWRVRRKPLVPLALLCATVFGGYALGALDWTVASGDPLRVSLLQGNIEQSMKWQPERLRQSLATYLGLAVRHPADLVVLPETALPLALDSLDPAYAEAISAAAGGAVLAGVVVRQADGRYFNSVVSLGRGPEQRYDKRHLVPFGEFTPPLFAWTLSLLKIPMSDFSVGQPNPPPLDLAGQRVALNICYEDIFGEEIIRALPAATLLVNLSNTAWFGDSAAQPQHLQIAQLRALESGRWMLRATNTGMTAAIDPRGRVAAALPPFTTGGLVVSVQGRSGSTPYARLGNGPVLVFSALLLCAIALWPRLRGRMAAKTK